MSKSKKDIYPALPCPLCGKRMGIRISKKSKPYCICFDCGMQLFVRNETGIDRLQRKTGFDPDDPLDRLLVRERKEEVFRLKKELQNVNREIEEDLWENRPELREKRDGILREIESLDG